MHSAVSPKVNPPVVVGIDGSRTHLATIDLGVAEAVRRSAPLLIVHVWPGRYSGSWRPRGPVPTVADGQHLLEVAARRAQHVAPGVTIDTEMATGSPAQILVRRSEQACLVVVGHRDAVVTQPSWGSTAAYLAHHGRCPLLVHRGSVSAQGPVVLAVSGRSSTATTACAFEEAAMSGNRLVAVYVWTRPIDRADTRLAAAAGYAADRQEAERHLAEALAGWTRDYPDVAVERLALHDLDVAYTLERASRRGRLLVAGMGGNGRFAELLYGSLGLALARQTVCPVMLVPSDWRHQAVGTSHEADAIDEAGGHPIAEYRSR
jgi:nucleotide-binding universal stress UspA family protein